MYSGFVSLAPVSTLISSIKIHDICTGITFTLPFRRCKFLKGSSILRVTRVTCFVRVFFYSALNYPLLRLLFFIFLKCFLLSVLPFEWCAKTKVISPCVLDPVVTLNVLWSLNCFCLLWQHICSENVNETVPNLIYYITFASEPMRWYVDRVGFVTPRRKTQPFSSPHSH